MFDIGVNLTSSQFAKDRAEVVARAKQAKLSGMLLTGSNLRESREASLLAQAYPHFCWSTAGVHPHDASSWTTKTTEELRALIHSCPEIVAVGECGLDFNRNFSTPKAQEEAFIAQLELAVELQRPLFLHCCDAHARFMTLLKPYLSQVPNAVVHCFTDDQAALESYLNEDLYIGITGWICDERRGTELRKLVTLITDPRLLLETDAPYLLPRNLANKPKSRRNEPCYLPHIVAEVAHLRAQAPEYVGQLATENAKRLFAF